MQITLHGDSISSVFFLSADLHVIHYYISAFFAPLAVGVTEKLFYKFLYLQLLYATPAAEYSLVNKIRGWA